MSKLTKLPLQDWVNNFFNFYIDEEDLHHIIICEIRKPEDEEWFNLVVRFEYNSCSFKDYKIMKQNFTIAFFEVGEDIYKLTQAVGRRLGLNCFMTKEDTDAIFLLNLSQVDELEEGCTIKGINYNE